MKLSVMITVVMVHVMTVGLVCIIQGCGTFRREPEPRSLPKPQMPGKRTTLIIPSANQDMGKEKPIQSEPAETTTYIVKKGDSLSVIAQRFGISTAALIGLNRIKNPNSISIDQSLLLPGKVDLKVSTIKTLKIPSSRDNTYAVKSGDSLSVIAGKVGTTVNVLREINGLSGDRIRVGQELIIPVALSPKAEASIGILQDVIGEENDIDLLREKETQAVGAIEQREKGAELVPSMRSYTVGEGEDLYSVSLMWDISTEELMRVNDLTETKLIPGQKLMIPTTP